MHVARSVRTTRATLRTLSDASLRSDIDSAALNSVTSGDSRPTPPRKLNFLTAAYCQSPVSDTERTGKSHYVDRIRVEVQAGNGGSGCIAFWKSAAKG